MRVFMVLWPRSALTDSKALRFAFQAGPCSQGLANYGPQPKSRVKNGVHIFKGLKKEIKVEYANPKIFTARPFAGRPR